MKKTILCALFLSIFSNQLKCMSSSNLSSTSGKEEEFFETADDTLFMFDNINLLSIKINQQLHNDHNIEQEDYNNKFLNLVYKEIFPQLKYQYYSENPLKPFMDTLNERDEKNKKEIITKLYPILFDNEQAPPDSDSLNLLTELETRLQQKNISHEEFLKTIDLKIKKLESEKNNAVKQQQEFIKKQQNRISTAFAEGILTCLAVVGIFWIKSYFSKR